MTNDHVGDAASQSQRSSRAMRWTVALGAVTMLVIGLVLLYLLMQATNNRELSEQSYALLFKINVAVAGILLAAIFWVAYRLLVRLRQGRFGSRLLVKLATIFALVGFAPGLLIYVVSYQFVSRSIETWFDVKVEGALEAGLNLGRVTLDTLSNDLVGKSRSAATQIAENPDAVNSFALERLVEQLNVTNATLWSGAGKLLLSAGQLQFQLTPEKPTTAQLRSARIDRAVVWIEGLEDTATEVQTRPRIKVLVPVSSPGLGLANELRFLLVARDLPSNLVANARAVETANREYQQLALTRQGLKGMYLGTLTLSLFLAVFGAILLAVILGNQIVRPLLLLAEGVSQVAAGDLTPKIAMTGRDELGGLTRAFAYMTEQLADARRTVERSMSQVDEARANLQTILDNLTAGVIVLGKGGEIRSSNPGATRILRVPLAAHQGDLLASVEGIQVFGKAVHAQFDEFLTRRNERSLDHWQRSFELGSSSGGPLGPFDQTVTLVARGAELPDNARLLVFDDISEIVSVQRSQAWGEVARRLAHEIKNPLTPIQLSAERLERRLTGKLPEAEQAVLNKSVKTIVDQVDAMKRLVNEFRDYARLPAAVLKPVDLNELVQDIAQLYEQQPGVVPLRLELQSACPMVLGDAQQLRQVIHNLVQNAQDASESNLADTPSSAEVVLRTQWNPEGRRVRMIVMDSGSGFSEHILKRAFEPYVTTKVKGTGLGLAVVKKIIDEHGGRIDITNRMLSGAVVGAQVSVSLDTYNSAPAETRHNDL